MNTVSDYVDTVASAELWADLGAPKLPPGMFYRVRESRGDVISAHFDVSIQRRHGKRGRSHSIGDVWLFPQEFETGREAVLAACKKCVAKARYRDPVAFSEQYRDALGYVGDHA